MTIFRNALRYNNLRFFVNSEKKKRKKALNGEF